MMTQAPLGPDGGGMPPRSVDDPSRFFVPHEAQRSAAPHASAMVADSPAATLVTCSSASGGVGTTTLAAMLAWQLRRRHASVALVDADTAANGGGLDVLLGIEHEEGKRWHSIHAPLGMLDGAALTAELPCWQDVHVLAYQPWAGQAPRWWEVQAALEALASVNAVTVVDAGHGTGIDEVDALRKGLHVVVAELTVLGLARAKAHMEWLKALTQTVRRSSAAADARRPPQEGAILAVIGVDPTSSSRRRGTVSLDEACAYLECDIAGPVHADSRLCGDLLEGLGMSGIPRRHRTAIEQVAQQVDRAL